MRLSIVLVIAAVCAAAPASACEPATGTSEALDEPWQAALADLVAATAEPGSPWSCPAAEVSLVAAGDGATLAVRRGATPTITRALAFPEDVVPMGKAVLAQSLPPQAPLEPINPVIPRADEPEPRPVDPRALVEATAGFRYGGVTEVLTAGGGLRGTLPFGRLGVALWGRYTTLASYLGDATDELDFGELAIGASLLYALIDDGVRLDAGVNGSLVVVDMEGERMFANDELETESGAVDGRMGLELRTAIPMHRLLRALIAVDAEMAPASLADSDRRLDPLLPPLPAYTVGMSLGLEVAVP